MEAQEPAVREFYARVPSLLGLWGGGGLLLASFLAIPSSPIFPGMPMLIACALIGAGLWFRFNPIVRLTDDEVSVKLAMLRPRKTVPVDDLKRVEATARKCVLHYRKATSGEGKVKIPLTSLAKADRDICAQVLQSRVPTD